MACPYAHIYAYRGSWVQNWEQIDGVPRLSCNQSLIYQEITVYCPDLSSWMIDNLYIVVYFLKKSFCTALHSCFSGCEINSTN